MRITRRAMLAASAAFGGLLSGCQAPQADQTETQEESMTDRTPRHFEDGKLTSDVDNQSVSTDAALNADNPYTVRVFKDGATIRAHARDEVVSTGSDAATVINDAIQHLGTATNTGGRIHIAGGEYRITSQIIILGSGSFDADYFSVEIVGEGLSSQLIMEDGAGLSPMIGMEIGETASPHRHEIRNLYIDGNRANNSSGTGIGHIEPDGHSGGLLEPMVRDCWVIEFSDTCIDFDDGLIDTPTVESCAIAYTDTGPALTFNKGHANNLVVHGAGGYGIVLGNSGPGRATLTNIKTYAHGDNGIVIYSDNNILSGVISYHNDGEGFAILGSGNTIFGISKGGDSQRYGLLFNSEATNNRFWGPLFQHTSDVSSGVDGNMINGMGYEGESASGPPSGSHWQDGDAVEHYDSSTDSRTIWRKSMSGSWIQIG